MPNKKHEKIAFITTPYYRKNSAKNIREFIYKNMYSLCRPFNVMTTGNTYDFVIKTVNLDFAKLKPVDRKHIAKDMNCDRIGKQEYSNWQKAVLKGLEKTEKGFRGMIHVAYELVEGRLDAIIHLTNWQDISAKPDSAVLAREANVHHVPIAYNCETANTYVESWKTLIARYSTNTAVFPTREGPKDPPLRDIKKEQKVLAMVAHDNMKLELCCYAVKKRKEIFKSYDVILATGTTGSWLKRFLRASGQSDKDIEKIRCCNSGPLGGDLQIAYAVVQGLCQRVVFFQDPSVSHPHSSDISLFEQAAVEGFKVQLATNVESANLLIFAPLATKVKSADLLIFAP